MFGIIVSKKSRWSNNVLGIISSNTQRWVPVVVRIVSIKSMPFINSTASSCFELLNEI
jgi:hypothetical protein